MIPRTYLPWAAALGLAIAGCGEPQVVPVAPPGVELTRVIPKEDEEPAQAIGEANNAAATTASAPVTLNAPDELPPTLKGEPKTTKSGLTYETLREGTGEGVKPGQQVTVHYVGTFPDGRTFDSSRERGEPFTLVLGKSNVIKGWHEGIAGMKVGEVRKLTIPPELAYGKEGRPPVIPANSTLVFQVELLKFQ